jgi:MFS family permease
LYRSYRRFSTIETAAALNCATHIDQNTWRGLYESGLLTRFVIMCFGIWLHAADTLVTATISPAIVEDIGGLVFINWTITVYEVGAIVAGAVAATLSQRVGVNRVLRWAAVSYGIGCLIAGLASTMAALLVGRLAQGIGGGMLLSLCYLAIQQWFAPSWWNRLFSVVAVIWGSGSLLGPLIGGIFAGLHAWRATFFTFAIQALALWLMAFAWLPTETPIHPVRKPLPLAPLGILSIATVLIAESSLAGSTAMSAVGCTVGVALLYLAARFDRRAVSRLFPSHLLHFGHPVSAGLLLVFALSVCTTAFWAYGPLLLKILFATRPLVSGYILAAEAIAWSLATMAVSTAPVSAERLLIRIGVILVAAGASGFVFVVPAGLLWGIVLCSLSQGIGFGLCWPSIVQRLTRFSDVAERSLAATSPETMQRIGYAVGAAAVGVVANTSGLAAGIAVGAAKSAAFWVFAALTPVLAVAVICAWQFTARQNSELPSFIPRP